MTTQVNGTPYGESGVSDLLLQLTRDVTQRSDPPYYELQLALEWLIHKINGDPAAGEVIDWPQLICEAMTLRPRPPV